MSCIGGNENHDWYGVGIHRNWHCLRCGKTRKAKKNPTRTLRLKFCTHKEHA